MSSLCYKAIKCPATNVRRSNVRQSNDRRTNVLVPLEVRFDVDTKRVPFLIGVLIQEMVRELLNYMRFVDAKRKRTHEAGHGWIFPNLSGFSL